MGYCSNADVGSRLGLDSGQRDRASSKITSVIRRAGLDIDQEFRYRGRDTPTTDTISTTLNGAVVAGATTITLTSGTGFSATGNGYIGSDSFKWTGKSTNDLTGVTNISWDHADDEAVEEGEFGQLLREICADLGASYYLEDESAFHQSGADPIRANVLRERAMDYLQRLAHLGSVD